MSELIEKIFEWLASDDAVWFFFGWEANMLLVEPNWASAIFCIIVVFLLAYKTE
jgi:hypothetical protein